MDNNLQDSIIKSTQNLQTQQTYHEVLINVECKQQYLQDIITQSIADIILEHGDGVEFMNNATIALECSEYNDQ